MNDKLTPFILDHLDRSGKIYSNNCGQSIIIFNYKQGLNNIFIKLQDSYQEVVSTGNHSSGGKESITLTMLDVPDYNRTQNLYVDSKIGIAVLTSFSGLYFFNESQNLTLDIISNIFYKALPDYVNIYLILENSDYLYAFIRNVYNNKHNTKILAYHKENAILEEIIITNTEKYRDGGTTYFYTNHGIFYLPTSFKPELKISLDEKEISEIKIEYKHYNIFKAKFEYKTPQECFNERIKNMQSRCAHRLEKAIIDEFGPGNWYSDEFQKQIMSKVNVLEFKEFLNNIE